MKRVVILAYDGCWGMSLFAVADFFRVVTLLEQHLGLAQGFTVQVCSLNGAQISVASGQQVRVDSALDTAQRADQVVIPAMEGMRLPDFIGDPKVLTWLAGQQAAGAQVLALSTGAALLAAAGVADGLLLTTHWAFVRQLQRRFPACRFTAHAGYMQDNGLYSTGTLEAGFDVLLEWLAEERGDPFAQLCATHLLIADPRQLRPILPGHRNHSDAVILHLQDWLESRYGEPVSLEQMASEAALSVRTLKRRFQQATGVPPNLYVQKVRVDKAKKLLLASTLSVKEIAFEVGYQNVSFFVRLFKTQTGSTPGQWRGTGVRGGNCGLA